ncbi:uncharacterized protein LOC128223796 [Mya arenaria]|uniref:uncharacterized protein LOC128223795 n=1 Tax=Mya arenaria TaxID=6604 RepID=UPI0022E1CD8C|nr:uncharacterized protein LOC128223795 [Mya arenaria]XP_052789149.1 uncharacterized protein LOC128223796 [Mya arenaria]
MSVRHVVLLCLVLVHVTISQARHPPREKSICPHGTVGNCLGFANQQCPPNGECRRVSGTFGICCRIPDPPVCGCRHGQRGICGGIANLRCPRGTTCQCSPNPPFPDSNGKCCRSRPVYGYNDHDDR